MSIFAVFGENNVFSFRLSDNELISKMVAMSNELKKAKNVRSNVPPKQTTNKNLVQGLRHTITSYLKHPRLQVNDCPATKTQNKTSERAVNGNMVLLAAK